MTKALSLAPELRTAPTWLLGVVQMFTNRAAQGIAECEQALALDRNLADAHACIGRAKYLLGRGAETEAHVQRGTPPLSSRYLRFRLDEVSGIRQVAARCRRRKRSRGCAGASRPTEINPRAHFYLAAALARLGDLMRRGPRRRLGLALDPGFTIRRFRANAPSDNPTYLAGRERFYEGMRMAGVPEG